MRVCVRRCCANVLVRVCCVCTVVMADPGECPGKEVCVMCVCVCVMMMNCRVFKLTRGTQPAPYTSKDDPLFVFYCLATAPEFKKVEEDK